MAIKERLGFDFDNTLTKLPFPFSFLNRVLNSTQTPKFLYRPYWKLVIRMPIFLNLRRLKILKAWSKHYDMYIITGRWKSDHMINRMLVSYGYGGVFRAIFAPYPPIDTTQKFKEKLCKALDIEYYFDDSYYTIYHLREKGIKAMLV